MQYYITDGKNILASVEGLSRFPPILNQDISFETKKRISGDTLYLVDDSGNLYFILTETFAVNGGLIRVSGVVTEVGCADCSQITAAIARYEMNPHEKPPAKG